MAVKRPLHNPLQLETSAVAQVRPTSDVGHEGNRVGGVDLASAASPTDLLPARSELAGLGERAQPLVGSASGNMFETRDAVRTRSLERASVVDGADRVVYSAIRDSQGWRQPLATREALNDTRRRGAGGGEQIGEGARIVRTLEGGPLTPTPYATGKATVLANSSGRLSQQHSSTRQLPQTFRDAATTRARAR